MRKKQIFALLAIVLINFSMLIAYEYKDFRENDYEIDQEDLSEVRINEDNSALGSDDILDDADSKTVVDEAFTVDNNLECIQCGNSCMFRNAHIRDPCTIPTENFTCELIDNECVKIRDPEAPYCGNYICEEGEADEYFPRGCGPNAPPGCIGPPARFVRGTCPEDCEGIDEEALEDDINEVGDKKLKLDIDLEIEEEIDSDETRFRYKLSDGREKELKVMPDAASEKVVEELRLEDCSDENNCEIVLKEVDEKDDVSAVYEISAEKEGWFLGLFKVRTQVVGQVDVDSGEVVKIDKPWWSFLVVGF